MIPFKSKGEQILIFFMEMTSLWCCSAILLGLGELRLEPVLGRKATVSGQHRDEPHDLRSVPPAHKTQHWQPQGKKSTFLLYAFIVLSSFWATQLIAIVKVVFVGLFFFF